MKKAPVIFQLFGHANLAELIQNKGHYDYGSITLHQFPDEETVIKIDADVRDRDLIFVASLDRPNAKLLPLLFAAETARSLGAARIVLVTPYLAYMRQDKVFELGQGITSSYFAKLISDYFDDLITIDPHLHRWDTLGAIYNIPTQVLHATNNIAHWVHDHIKKPVLIGPDIESKQWVEDIALKTNAPYLVLNKIRHGDKQVEVSIPDIDQYHDYTPVLIDDIISTGMTMIDTMKHLRALNMSAPVCIGVHAVFAGDAYQKLLAAGVDQLITCNTIPHVSNQIDISNNVIDALVSCRLTG